MQQVRGRTMNSVHNSNNYVSVYVHMFLSGVWTCALAEFYVDREIMHHIIQSYIPTTLIVIISWFSFWLDVEAVPGECLIFVGLGGSPSSKVLVV